jgi:hypothetical protein
VAYKQSMGMRFHTEARTLRSFCRTMGDIAVADIAAGRVHAYIAGSGPVTLFWHRKYAVLRGFYRFAIARSSRLVTRNAAGPADVENTDWVHIPVVGNDSPGGRLPAEAFSTNGRFPQWISGSFIPRAG